MAYEGYLLIGAALLWVTSDVIFAFLTTHVSLQLEVSLTFMDLSKFSVNFFFLDISRCLDIRIRYERIDRQRG